MKKFIYLDIDGVLNIGYYNQKVNTKFGWMEMWDKKAVEIFNDIITQANAEIIVSSDWKLHFDIDTLVEIFEFQGINKSPIDITPDNQGRILEKLEEDRAAEILQHVEEYKPDFWVAIDDLDLSPYIDDEHFIHLPRWMEGIKQSSKKEKIIKILNK